MISLMQKPRPDTTQHSQETDIHAPGGIWPTIPEATGCRPTH